MFNFNKNKNEFLFWEVENNVYVYSNVSGVVKEVGFFSLDNLSVELEKIKKNHQEIVKSKTYWVLEARLESIDKAPLAKEEMVNYAKWKIQELVDVPMHDISYDLLTNNNVEVDFYKKHATAIIAKKARIDYILSSFLKNKINLTSIDHRSTAVLDSLINSPYLKQKSLAILNLKRRTATIQIYYEKGVVFERVVELPYACDEEIDLSEEENQILLDKICLEMQRNVDFVDRQYNVPHIENIVFISPTRECYVHLQKEIASYFNVNVIDAESLTKFKAQKGADIPFYVLAAFERGMASTEQINLKPIVKKEVNLQQDLQKVVGLSLLIGVAIAGTGSYYEFQAKKIKAENESLAKSNSFEKKKLEDERNRSVSVDQNLEKDIAKLIKNKAEVILLNTKAKDLNTEVYKNILKDLAITAKNSGVVLNKIKITEAGISLQGKGANKSIFIDFLNNLKTAESLKGKDLGNIFIEQKNSESIEFTISSNGLGDRK